MAHSAETLLKQLLGAMPIEFFAKKSLHIVVLSAGTFPSFLALIRALMHTAPSLVEANISLVEPVKWKTDDFQQRSSTQLALQKKVGPRISITVYNNLIDEFLQTPSPAKFDIIYFEHADLRTLPILLAKSTTVFRRSVSLRYSVPLLTKIMQPQTFIIASCLSLHECWQLQSLLRFSFNTRPHIVKLNGQRDYFYGGRFCAGAFATVQAPRSVVFQKKRANRLKINDNDLYRVVWLSCLLFMIKLYSPQTTLEWSVAGSLIALQLLFHHYGKNATVLKLFLLIGLIVI